MILMITKGRYFNFLHDIFKKEWAQIFGEKEKGIKDASEVLEECLPIKKEHDLSLALHKTRSFIACSHV